MTGWGPLGREKERACVCVRVKLDPLTAPHLGVSTLRYRKGENIRPCILAQVNHVAHQPILIRRRLGGGAGHRDRRFLFQLVCRGLLDRLIGCVGNNRSYKMELCSIYTTLLITNQSHLAI